MTAVRKLYNQPLPGQSAVQSPVQKQSHARLAHVARGPCVVLGYAGVEILIAPKDPENLSLVPFRSKKVVCVRRSAISVCVLKECNQCVC
jgi:hypothetical protein